MIIFVSFLSYSMSKINACIFFILVLVNCPVISLSQGGEQDGAPCWLCRPGEHNNKSPYEYSFKRELPYLITGAGLVITGRILYSNNAMTPITEDELESYNRSDVNPFDRPATYNWSEDAEKASDILRAGAILLPVLFLSSRHTRSEFGSLAVMGLEVATITYGLTLSVKNIARRPRPYVYNPEAPVGERTSNQSELSFYSGHVSVIASMSFFTAKVMHDYHPNMKTGLKITMWSLAAALPAVTAYLRVEAGQHFPTDVITGYAIGAFTGWLIPHLHKKKGRHTNKLSMCPVIYDGTPGLYLSLRL